MSVDIITTTYRNVDKLRICLNSVVEKTKFVDFTWYVWANEPNKEVEEVIHDSMYIDDILFNEHIEPIFNDNNDGSFSSNNNEAVAEGDAEYILFLNDDIEPINDAWLLNMTRILDTDPKVGAVGALLLYPNKKLVQHCGVMFDQRTNGLPYHIFYKKPFSKFMQVNRYYQSVTAACMLVRREDFEKLNGFDESYIYGYEDIDLCLRLKHELEKNTVYCADAQLIHHEGISGTFKEHPHLKNNMKIFREKWGSKIFNDHQFYLQNSSFMAYKAKAPLATNDDE
jgi:GT2 family glycosyltransferase